MAVLLSAVPAYAAPPPSSSPSEIVQMGGRAYFAATTAAHGRELWTTDGTRAGTYELQDINPSGSSDPNGLTVVGNKLFFAAHTGLWVTDGTEPGTMLLSAGSVQNPRRVGGLLFFMRDYMIWTSDGTVGGTDPVATIPDVEYFAIGGAIAYKGAYYFAISQESEGWSLWSSDGTSGGTGKVADLAPFRNDVDDFVVAGGLLYFSLMEAGGGGAVLGDLWKSDGTALGTKQVKDIDTEPVDEYDADGVDDLTNVGGTLYFSLGNAEIWKSNGTAAGTKRLRVLNDWGSASFPMVFARLGNTLLASGFDGTPGGLDLWRSQGTMASTVEVHPAGPFSCTEGAVPDPGCIGSLNYKPASAGELLFYPAEEGTQGIELWASNGTTEGTRRVKDIAKGNAHSRPSDLARFGTKILFVAKDGSHGRELWISDGTAAGTKMVKDINL